jgi:hypothetical protein
MTGHFQLPDHLKNAIFFISNNFPFRLKSKDKIQIYYTLPGQSWRLIFISVAINHVFSVNINFL